MYLADHHIHSCCSPDSEAPLSEMLRAAQAAGLSDLCATDHCDLLDLDGGRVTGLDWAPILTQYQAARGDCPAGVKLRLGLELGGAPVDPDCAAAILSGADLDFVIGSIHNLSPAKGGKDFYFLDYTTPRACYEALDDYFDSRSIWTAGTRWAISSTPFGICRRSLGILSLWRGTRTACARSSPGWPRRGGPLR